MSEKIKIVGAMYDIRTGKVDFYGEVNFSYAIFEDMVLMSPTLLNPIFLFSREAAYFSIVPVEL
ncbi:MAG: hypothetical protein IPN42_04535 [Methylococcaceae bacterium]|nr:hypothetical protein [Methylococcaceae bacterium]